MATVTFHDITANGKTYILEWLQYENQEQPGYITITGTTSTNTEFGIPTFDFKEVIQ